MTRTKKNKEGIVLQGKGEREKKERWKRRLISHFTFPSLCFVSRASQLLFLLLAFTVLELRKNCKKRI